MVDYEQRVREAAYFLWQAEGCPEGRAEIHWRMAEIATVLFSYLNQGVRQLPPQNLSDASAAKAANESTTLHFSCRRRKASSAECERGN